MTLTETEIWLADVAFILKDSKRKYIVKDQVVPNKTSKELTEDPFYMKRFMSQMSITLIKSLLKEKEAKFPVATV